MDKNQIFGGNPLGVVIRLAVLSIVVGIVLSALNIQPSELVQYIRLLIQRIYNLGFGAFESLLGYLLIGAVVVIPIWLLTRVFAGLRKKSDTRQP